MNTLHDALERATDAIEAPRLAPAALLSARRRRARRRGAAAGVVAAVAVGAIVTATVVNAGSGTPGPAVPSLPTSSQESTTEIEPDPEPATAPPIDPAVVQDLWDPATVADLPWAEGTSFPRSLDPRDVAATQSDDTPVLAAVDDGEAISLWHASGARTEIDYPEPAFNEHSAPALSPDGSVVAFAGRSALWTSTDGGEWARRAYPDGFQVAPDWGVELDLDADGGLLVGQFVRDWRSWYLPSGGDGATSRLEGAPYDLAAAPDGALLGFLGGPPRQVVEFRGGEQTSAVYSDELQSLNRPAATDDVLAAVRGVGNWTPPREGAEENGLIAVERDTLATRAYLPIRDPHDSYTDGGTMAALAWLDDETVLASVILGGTPGTQYLFTWNVATGQLSRVSELPAALLLAVASAPGE
ncbi:hypothetical protein [Nocardioides sp. GXZ039]|uniref:hypothetical protein n=1 Tax=Nocardioides sp. GXZ039 TaxID=3136018 RepID=UPI0030F39984